VTALAIVLLLHYIDYMNESALILVDIQNYFCPGGTLAVPGGDSIVPTLNGILEKPDRGGFLKVAATADWHPEGHVSFASSHEGKEPFETVEMEGLEQHLWPEHCIAGTVGAALHPDLAADAVDIIIRKGRQRGLDSYSAFFENDGLTRTGLNGFLSDFGIRRVYLAGLALDWCVYYTAKDSRRLGFETVILEDLSLPVDQPAGFAAERVAELKERGVLFLNSASLPEHP
jgi:nicotinamidase/pyrazinamidase